MFQYEIDEFAAAALAVRRRGRISFEQYRSEAGAKVGAAQTRLNLVLRALTKLTGVDFTAPSARAVFAPRGPLSLLRDKPELLLSSDIQLLLQEVSRVGRYICRHVEHVKKLTDGATEHLGILDPFTDLNRLIEQSIQVEQIRHPLDFQVVEVRQVAVTLPQLCADHARLMIAFRELIRTRRLPPE